MVRLTDNLFVPDELDLYFVFSKLFEYTGEPGNMVASLLITKSYYWGALLTEAMFMKLSISGKTSKKPDPKSKEIELAGKISNLISKDLSIPGIKCIKPEQKNIYKKWIKGSFSLPKILENEYCDSPSDFTRHNMSKRCHLLAFRTVYENNNLSYKQWYEARNKNVDFANLVYGVSRIIRGIRTFSNTVTNLEFKSFDYSKLKKILVEYAYIDDSKKGINGEKYKKIVEAFKNIELGRLSLVEKHLKNIV
ncbi:hypothetical protein AYI70_g10244 [Smittium culicis]|uniref:Uncharacterized protein n=1 Tax=Smittium culicis TaxID=133412 RepID=A0A1R1X7J2_9FUNG|nr:hypothetical protein AYI70_g10244 [Smittium culicis]